VRKAACRVASRIIPLKRSLPLLRGARRYVKGASAQSVKIGDLSRWEWKVEEKKQVYAFQDLFIIYKN
jgi:hypothetical protein